MTTAKHDRIEVRSTIEEKKEFEEAAMRKMTLTICQVFQKFLITNF